MSLDVYLTNDPCPHCGRGDDSWSANITHNLGRMAHAAGIYTAVWRPEECGIVTAAEIADVLRPALEDMRARPEYYRQFDAENGWGTYDQFVPWLDEYLHQCEAWPLRRPEHRLRAARDHRRALRSAGGLIMPIDYAVVRAELLAQREAIDAALRAFDVIFPTRSTTDGAYVTAPPQPAPTRRSSRPGAPDPAPAPAPPSEAPTRPRKVRTTRPASSATAPGPSNIEKSQHWQAQATKALRAGEGDATVRELAARLRLTGDEAYQSLWRALQVLVAHKAVVRTGTRYRLAAAQGEAA